MALITPAILAADFAELGQALKQMRDGGASMLHVDVMDGHFVPSLSVGQPVVRSLRTATDLVLEVHLLIQRPERYVAEFAEAGADRIAVHVESTPHLHRVIEQIRTSGAKAGVALNPATPVGMASEVLEEIDFMTILSADPGLREGSFIPQAVARLRMAAEGRAKRHLQFAIEAEGAVGFENLGELIRAGADILVIGSAIFQSQDPSGQLGDLMSLASALGEESRV